jgi:hypothetical protein
MFALVMVLAVMWPATPAGVVAHRWVDAFPSETKMRAFLVQNVDEEGFRQRSLDSRLTTYRQSKKKLGTLKLVSIESSKPHELKVTLVSANGERHPFTFTVQSAPPHKLISIARTELHRHRLFPGH